MEIQRLTRKGKSGHKNEQNLQHLDGPISSTMQSMVSNVPLVGGALSYGMGVAGNSISYVAQSVGASKESGDDIGAGVAGVMFAGGMLYGGEKIGRWANEKNGKLAPSKDFSWTDSDGKAHKFKAGEALDFDKHSGLEDFVKDKKVSTRGADTFINKNWDKAWDGTRKSFRKGGEFIRESFFKNSDSEEPFEKSNKSTENTSDNDHSNKSENEKPHSNSFDKDNKTSSNDGVSDNYTENNEKSQVKSEHSAKNKAQSLLDYAKKHPKKMDATYMSKQGR